MRKLRLALALLALAPAASQATPAFAVTALSCSGAQTLELGDFLSFACAGDLVLDGGIVSADRSVMISAGGELRLNNLAITAPRVELAAGGALTIGAGASIHAADQVLVIAGPRVADVGGVRNIAPGGTISLGGIGDIRPELPTFVGVLPGQVLLQPGDGTITFAAAVPEPSSYAAIGAGLLVLAALRRRKHRPGV